MVRTLAFTLLPSSTIFQESKKNEQPEGHNSRVWEIEVLNITAAVSFELIELEMATIGIFRFCCHNQPTYSLLKISYLFLSVSLCLSEPLATTASEERCILMEFFTQTNGQSWSSNTNWATWWPLLFWDGVELDNRFSVIELNLQNHSLCGEKIFVASSFLSTSKLERN